MATGNCVIAVQRPARKNWWVRSRGWMAIVLMTPFAAGTLASCPTVREDSLWTYLLTAVAWILFVAGVTFRWWATLHVEGRKTQVLVSDGPYSLCRNPLYLGTFLMTLAIAFYVESATFAAGLAIAAFFYLGVTVPHEERLLRDRFGEAYERYCEDVPRFLPRFRKPSSPARIEVVNSGLASEAIRAARYLWVPLIAQTIAHLRAESWWPHWWVLP